MVAFTGGAGTVVGNPGLFEWTDVIIVVENNVIVDFFTQFSGEARPGPGASVEIGAFNVRLSSLTYQHLGDPVGAGFLSLLAGGQLELAASGFKIEGGLSNSGSLTVSQIATIGGPISNGGLMTVTSFLQLEGDGGQTVLNGIGDMRLRGGFVTGFGGESSLNELNNQSRISGHGTIGAEFNWLGFPRSAGYLSVVNSALGVIDADVDGQTLTISTTLSDFNPVENAGLLSASGGGTLRIQGGFVEQSGTGVIRAYANSKVVFDNITLTGGTLASEGTGFIKVEGSTTRIADVAIAAGSTLNTGRHLALEGTITNRGTIVADEFDNVTRIDADGVTLTGGGNFVLYDNYNESEIFGEGPGAVLTIGNQTIRGNGYIWGANLSVMNDGVISAQPDSYTSTADTLFVSDLARLVNTGVLEARSGAILALNNPGTGLIENVGGVIRAVGADAIVNLGNATISGGKLATSDGGIITSGAATLDGSAFKIVSTATVNINDVQLRMKGEIANEGQMNFISRSGVIFTGDTTLTGGGEMSISPAYFESDYRVSAAGTVVKNLDHTISGGGSFGAYTGMVFVNGRNGVLSADLPGNHFWVQTGNIVTNNGVLRANGGILDVQDNVVGKGWLEVMNGGRLNVDQGTDQKVRFVGPTGDELLLLRREASAGGYDFAVFNMGVDDRISMDVGFGTGATTPFTFQFTSKGAILSTGLFTDGAAQPYQIRLSGRYSEGQFELMGDVNGRLAFVRVETKNGSNGDDRLAAVNTGERLIGFDGDDTLTGKGGDDVLDGSRGVDTASYANADVAVTVSLNTTAAQAVGTGLGMDRLLWIENLVGSSRGDTLTGNSGANQLDGGRGADTLSGLGGNDSYVVDRLTDVVNENAGEGSDTVLALSSYTLAAAAEIEVLRALSPTGTDGFALTGNGFAQKIFGNAGANRIDGGGGRDTVRGLGGADDFVISASLGSDNVLTVLDFAADDSFILSRDVFGLAGDTLTDAQFVANTAGTAGNATQVMIYDLDSGRLIFDADGQGGNKGIVFAVIGTNLSIGAENFLIA